MFGRHAIKKQRVHNTFVWLLMPGELYKERAWSALLLCSFPGPRCSAVGFTREHFQLTRSCSRRRSSGSSSRPQPQWILVVVAIDQFTAAVIQTIIKPPAISKPTLLYVFMSSDIASLSLGPSAQMVWPNKCNTTLLFRSLHSHHPIHPRSSPLPITRFLLGPASFRA